MTWTNEDGLVQRFGVERSTSQTQGVSTRGVKNYLVVDLPDATALVNTLGTSYPPDEDSPYIPANSLITGAWFAATTDFTSGGSATLDIGLISATGAITDADGIAADVTITELTDAAAAGSVACDGAYVCNGSGSTTTVRDGAKVVGANAYIGFSYETAVFTAGAGTLVVEYIKL